jgi:hypothetical protein
VRHCSAKLYQQIGSQRHSVHTSASVRIFDLFQNGLMTSNGTAAAAIEVPTLLDRSFEHTWSFDRAQYLRLGSCNATQRSKSAASLQLRAVYPTSALLPVAQCASDHEAALRAINSTGKPGSNRSDGKAREKVLRNTRRRELAADVQMWRLCSRYSLDCELQFDGQNKHLMHCTAERTSLFEASEYTAGDWPAP